MSKKYSLAGVFVMAVAVAAWACPPEGETSTVKKEGGCQGKAQTVAEKAGKEGCCKKGAQTVAEKAGGEGCCKKGAQTVAEKAGGEGCKKGVQTVADKASGGGCCKGGKTAALVAEVRKSLPKLTYKVGEKETPCPDSAAALAAETEGAKIKYIVSDQSFDTKDEAQVRLASLLEGSTNDLLTIGYAVDGECSPCPDHARQTAEKKNSKVTYRVAGVNFSSKEYAEKAIANAREALAKVTVTKKIGDKEESVKCLDDAKCSDKATYTVAGDQTECPLQAKVLLAEAKIRAIVEAAISSAS